MPALHYGGGNSETKLWTFTNNFNMRDLSRDDDFLRCLPQLPFCFVSLLPSYFSYLLVETFGTDDMPLTVHRMEYSRRFPPFDHDEVLEIVKKACHFDLMFITALIAL